jgi:hypothetical protein
MSEEREADPKITEHGGRDAAPGDAGEPLTEDGPKTGTSTGTPGKVREGGDSEGQDIPHREQGGL